MRIIMTVAKPFRLLLDISASIRETLPGRCSMSSVAGICWGSTVGNGYKGNGRSLLWSSKGLEAQSASLLGGSEGVSSISAQNTRVTEFSKGCLQKTFYDIAEGLKEGKFRRVIVLSGAGVSCSAGIPDFRTPGTGLYQNLDSYNIPYPEAIFELDFYRTNPYPFITLAKDIWPGRKYKPTIAHSFVRLLDVKGYLLRNYTQNIDGLEVLAGVPPDKMVECHGHFRSASCIECGAPCDIEICKESMLEKKSVSVCSICSGLIKPDIVFFGEALPSLFLRKVDSDVQSCDMLIVMGTSLAVYPVAQIPNMVKTSSPIVVLNREQVEPLNNRNTIFVAGQCDDSVRKLCKLAGWIDELEMLHESTESK